MVFLLYGAEYNGQRQEREMTRDNCPWLDAELRLAEPLGRLRLQPIAKTTQKTKKERRKEEKTRMK